MKLPRLLLLVSLAASCVAWSPVGAAPASGPVYELRTYISPPGKRDALLARFRDHTVKLFEKHGMVNVAYWVPMDEKDRGADKLIYLLEHKSREAADVAWKGFIADPEWKDVNKKTTAKGPIVEKLESLYLTRADFGGTMQAGLKAGGAQRAFELRIYTTPEGKLKNLDARFRDHTVKLFEKHGMTNLAYFHPLDADKGAANTLVYFLAHASREAAAASFKAFREDPTWTKVRTESEKDGKITSKVESVFLKPVDFSKVK